MLNVALVAWRKLGKRLLGHEFVHSPPARRLLKWQGGLRTSGFDKEITGFVKDGTATVNGQAVEAFKQPTHAGSGTVYISQSSTPEIVRLQGPSNEGQINFTNYNAPATITAPAASDVIDGSKFGL